MSRRTKLIIAALFLVLLAVPAAYVALTWHPAFPLRFHLESIDSEPLEEDPRYRGLRVRVENTSPIPVHICGGMLYTNFGIPVFGGPEGLLLPLEFRDGIPSRNPDEPVIVPAHGELHIRGALGAKLTQIPQGGEISVQCTWETATRAGAGRAVNWIRYSCPQWETGRLPMIEPLRTTVPLETKGHAPAPPQEPSAP
ncbi:hypothetical protein [Roseimicrobium sp. ORNL1]|uniref:hypothetical protein n=1 Tax=Roseimicrobium sp. ORNL1 TaxID=2711231 RepID=UPI0013E118C5|nr:hypothetical protein [Roseimicrobium sp. ORNL1]QIF01951.1 hypothetical protein G5S37_10560 [Roseimicrobium sp. ORNL1]